MMEFAKLGAVSNKQEKFLGG
jgi:hypothetical protein